ncbi:MAG: hypothetical protein H6636_14065, partial [Anaerolineales bacterium]|nr:hypothetical protein [Anaerolineales bacterium]
MFNVLSPKLRAWGMFGLITLLLSILILILGVAYPAQSHSFPIIDGLFTGDWCGPSFLHLYGPDTFTTLSPPTCGLGTEYMWDDWDTFYSGGAVDTMGWLLGGLPMAPVPDKEVDIEMFLTTADASNVYFAVQLGAYPSTGGPPPHLQIAIDLDGPLNGNPMPYDPLAVGTLPLGLATIVGPLHADYLVTTDVVLATAFVWESFSTPGTWLPVGVVPLGWSGGGPVDIVEIAVPWSMFTPGPLFAPGVPAHLTVVSMHGAPFTGVTDAPMTPQEDVFSEFGAGFTTSVDVCPPAPLSTMCEFFVAPGGGGGSDDAFLAITYPLPITATPSPTVTHTPTITHTPTETSTPSVTPTLTLTATPT